MICKEKEYEQASSDLGEHSTKQPSLLTIRPSLTACVHSLILFGINRQLFCIALPSASFNLSGK